VKEYENAEKETKAIQYLPRILAFGLLGEFESS